MKLLAIVLLAWIFSGCAPVNPCGSYNDGPVSHAGDMCTSALTREWKLDSRFSGDQLEGITTAGWDWEQATGGRVKLSFRVVDEGADIFLNDHPPKNQNGSYDRELDTMWFSHTLLPDWYRRVASHEFGHTFGLPHSREVDDAMSDPAAHTVGGGDVRAFDRLWRDRK